MHKPGPDQSTILQQYFDDRGVEYLNYKTKDGALIAKASMTLHLTKAPMTKAFPPEEIAAWRDEDPEGFAKWAAENAEEYEAWLKANPEYAEKK